MTKINGFNEITAAKANEKLVPGAYVAEIMTANTVRTNWGAEQLQITIEIAEGPLAGFYKRKYEKDKQGQYAANAKYKGILKLTVPGDMEQGRGAGYKKQLIKALAENLQESNQGYKWDWDESKLAGLHIGILVGDVTTIIDGREITYQEIKGQTCTVEQARLGTVETPKHTYRNGAEPEPAKPETTATAPDPIIVVEGEPDFMANEPPMSLDEMFNGGFSSDDYEDIQM